MGTAVRTVDKMHVLALFEAEHQAGHHGAVSYVHTIYQTSCVVLAL